MIKLSKRIAAVLAGASLAGPAAAVKQPSVQQQFDAASAYLTAERWADAARAFAALEGRLTRNARTLAVVRLRKAIALEKLGRDEEAAAALEASLAGLPPSDATLLEDRLEAMLTLGAINERALDYPAALRLFRASEAVATSPPQILRALAGSIRSGMFYDAPRALADAEKALSIIRSQPGNTAELLPQYRILKGRVLLNLRRYRDARAEFAAANAKLGGLSMTVNAADIAARSDLAIAALLSGDEETARKYLAYSGAGRLRTAFGMGPQMQPPACGRETGLEATDVAVVEFAIKADGSVASATPIYSSKQGDAALEFARAVSGWSWTPAEMKEIPPLFRALTRVELRCTTSPQRPSITEILEHDLTAWAGEKGLAASQVPDGPDARRAEALAAELTAREARRGANSPHLLPVLAELSANTVVPAELAAAHAARGYAIAKQSGAPAQVAALFGIRKATSEWTRKNQGWKRMPDFGPLMIDPAVMADPRAAAAVRLVDADHRYRIRGARPEVIAAVAAIEQVPGRGKNDPLRAAALVRLASLKRAAGDEAAARTAFQASGLTPDQCALLDTPPRLKRHGASSSDFPMAAIRWGFEGWATIEFDITADGLPARPRTVTAYPPFVFGDAALSIVEDTRFEKSFRPDGGLGCGGSQQRIRFVLPS